MHFSKERFLFLETQRKNCIKQKFPWRNGLQAGLLNQAPDELLNGITAIFLRDGFGIK